MCKNVGVATLSQLLALPDLALRLIQAGPGDPELSWVSTTELLDLSAYLEGGEIILTTGLALGVDDPRWRDFVASLSRARVAAIGFGVGVNHDRVPARLVQAASMYRVALFEIPLPVPFIAVSKAVAELITADELRVARNALRVQQRLLDGARGDQDPAEVLAGIAQATGRHLALVGSDDALIARTAGYPTEESPELTEVVPLDEQGALRLAIAGSGPLTPEGRSVIAAGAMVLGISLRGDRADEARERERWERLTADLLDGSGSPRGIRILDPSLNAPERVRAIAVQGTAEDVAGWRRRPRSGADRLIAADAPPSPGLGRAWQLCPDGAVDAALRQARAHGLDAVVGRATPLAEAAFSRRSASARLSALSVTAPLYTAPRVPQTVWADRDAPILDALLDDAAGRRERSVDGAADTSGDPLSARVLGPLSRRDSTLSDDERTGLRATLRTVFETDGQRGPAAAALGIHRNTLRDRLSRIERLTGRRLSDPDDRAELWLALRMEELAGA